MRPGMCTWLGTVGNLGDCVAIRMPLRPTRVLEAARRGIGVTSLVPAVEPRHLFPRMRTGAQNDCYLVGFCKFGFRSPQCCVGRVRQESCVVAIGGTLLGNLPVLRPCSAEGWAAVGQHGWALPGGLSRNIPTRVWHCHGSS